MILADTSVWIELLAGRIHASADDIRHLVTCEPVVQEVFQGLPAGRQSQRVRWQLLGAPRLSDPLPVDCFVDAADLYALGRRKGITVRSAIDCLVAAIAIKNRVPVWHADRDFDHIASYSPLQIWKPEGSQTAL